MRDSIQLILRFPKAKVSQDFFFSIDISEKILFPKVPLRLNTDFEFWPSGTFSLKAKARGYPVALHTGC